MFLIENISNLLPYTPVFVSLLCVYFDMPMSAIVSFIVMMLVMRSPKYYNETEKIEEEEKEEEKEEEEIKEEENIEPVLEKDTGVVNYGNGLSMDVEASRIMYQQLNPTGDVEDFNKLMKLIHNISVDDYKIVDDARAKYDTEEINKLRQEFIDDCKKEIKKIKKE
jgi:flagellar biosynthesis component FlhA